MHLLYNYPSHPPNISSHFNKPFTYISLPKTTQKSINRSQIYTKNNTNTNTMNKLAIALVITSLLTTIIIVSSTSPPRREVIVKEGHRAVVVEYDTRPDGTTKVLISPHDQHEHERTSNEKQPTKPMFSGPRDLVCDAFGKCKHKVATALHKTKEKVVEMEEHAKEVASEALGKDKLNQRVSGHTNSVTQGITKVKELVGDVTDVLKDGASKDFDVIDSPKRIAEDIAWNVTGGFHETVKNVHKLGKKSISDILYKIKEVTLDVVWYMLYRDKMNSIIGLIHMLGFSTAYGMCVWVTFVSSYVLGRYLPKQVFGMVQSRMYPVYFKAMAYCVSAALLGHLVSQRSEILSNKMGLFQTLCLLSALLMVLTNLVLLEPKATKAMYERMKIEKEEGRGVAVTAKEGMVDGRGPTGVNGGGPTVVRSTTSVVADRRDVLRLNEKLKRLNAYSSALNLSTLVALTWHMAYMGQRLQATR